MKLQTKPPWVHLDSIIEHWTLCVAEIWQHIVPALSPVPVASACMKGTEIVGVDLDSTVGSVYIYMGPATCPTDSIFIEFEILSKFEMLWFKMC